ncbi:MAG: NrsF family protein [Allorhizobium sp.]
MKTEKLIDWLAEDLAFKPPVASKLILFWLPIAALATGIIFLGLVGIRTDLTSTGAMPTLVKVGLGLVIAIAAVRGTRTLLRPEASIAQGIAAPFAVFLSLSLLLALDLASWGQNGFLGRLLGKSITSCLTVIPLLAAIPLVTSLMALRAGATSHPAFIGALAGLASAGLAIVAYGLYCTEDSPSFVAVWYSLAAVIVALVGSMAGRRWLRW